MGNDIGWDPARSVVYFLCIDRKKIMNNKLTNVAPINKDKALGKKSQS